MANYRGIMVHIDRGRGKAAQRLGQPYNVFRIQNNSAANYLDAANQIAVDFPVLRRVIRGGPDREAPEMGSLLFEIVADMSNFQTGDVFVQNDPFYGVGGTLPEFATPQFNAFVLGFHAPIRKSLGGRLDHLAYVYRQPSGPDANGYWSADTLASSPVMLQNGVFSVGSPGQTPALIPVGLQASERFHGEMIDLVPTATPTTRWMAFVPAMPGFLFREGDRIITQDESGGLLATGARYVVVHPYEQEAGLVGSQLVLEREVAQA